MIENDVPNARAYNATAEEQYIRMDGTQYEVTETETETPETPEAAETEPAAAVMQEA
jgi:hypothetical protein